MNTTQLIVKLIKQYNVEHNRLTRARYAKHKISGNQKFQEDMKLHGLCPYTVDEYQERDIKRFKSYFVDDHGRISHDVFVSKAIKTKHVRQAEKELAEVRAAGSLTAFHLLEAKNQLNSLKGALVLVELGAKWRRYVAACMESDEAYEARWQVRCAIKAINKLDLGMQIKFGNCTTGGGSMSRIRFVNVDGFDVPVKKFLENAQFEEAVLAA